MRRLLLAATLWGLLTGGTVIKCSSDPGNLGPGTDAPVAADGFYTVAVNGTVTGFMRATDPNDLSLTFTVVSGPGQGSLQGVDAATGRFTYVPSGVGGDSFSFRASNRFSASNTAVVSFQIYEPSARASAAKPSGTLQVADDPSLPGAMLVLWDDGRGTLQRVFRGQPVPAETLATGVRAFRVDPLRPWAIAASVEGDTVIVSSDGGGSWREGSPLPTPCPPRGAGGDTGPGLPEGCPSTPDPAMLPAVSDGQREAGAVLSLVDDPARTGTWRWSLSGAGRTTVLETRDGGGSWTMLRQLEIGNLRLTDCAEPQLCLLSADGAQLWRLDGGR